MKWIKLYGERNTNTNYLSKLIELNLDAPQIQGVVPRSVFRLQTWAPGDERIRDWYFSVTFGRNLGWKHMRVEPAEKLRSSKLVRDGKVGFVTITKNPYSWLLSLYRRPYSLQVKPEITFEDFLTMPWQTTGRDNLRRRRLKSPVELWNLKNASYLALSNALPIVHLTTEFIFSDPDTTIRRIADAFNIRRLTDKFLDYERSTKDRSKDSNYYRDYYANEKWREQLSKAAIDTINANIDKDLLRHYGYELIE